MQPILIAALAIVSQFGQAEYRARYRENGQEYPAEPFTTDSTDFAVSTCKDQYGANLVSVEYRMNDEDDFETVPTTNVGVYRSLYQNNNATAIILMDEDTDQDWATVTTNLPQSDALSADQFYVKNWSENEPIIPQLVAAGIIKLIDGESVPTGHVSAPLYTFGENAAMFQDGIVKHDGDGYYIVVGEKAYPMDDTCEDMVEHEWVEAAIGPNTNWISQRMWMPRRVTPI